MVSLTKIGFAGANIVTHLIKHTPSSTFSGGFIPNLKVSVLCKYTPQLSINSTAIKMTSTDSRGTERSEKEIIANVLKYWFGDDTFPPYENYKNQVDLWYGSSEQIDADIRQRFGRETDDAISGKLDHFIGNTNRDYKSNLALVVMLDQFPRNIYRGSEKAFAGDAKARAVVQHLLDTQEWDGLKNHFSPVARMSFLLPLMHQESLDGQVKCVELIQSMIEECKSAGKQAEETVELLQKSLQFAQLHREIIEQFGRFPYRNKALSRPSTPEEERYLIDGPSFGQ